jgi:hypothetical protein
VRSPWQDCGAVYGVFAKVPKRLSLWGRLRFTLSGAEIVYASEELLCEVDYALIACRSIFI